MIVNLMIIRRPLFQAAQAAGGEHAPQARGEHGERREPRREVLYLQYTHYVLIDISSEYVYIHISLSLYIYIYIL